MVKSEQLSNCTWPIFPPNAIYHRRYDKSILKKIQKPSANSPVFALLYKTNPNTQTPDLPMKMLNIHLKNPEFLDLLKVTLRSLLYYINAILLLNYIKKLSPVIITQIIYLGKRFLESITVTSLSKYGNKWSQTTIKRVINN